MKKFNKMEKWLFGVIGMFCGFAIALGLGISGIKCFAQDVDASAESTESVEILDDTATDEEVVDGVETNENSFVYDAVGNVYYYVSPDYTFHTIMFTILENEKIKVDMFDGDDLLATVYGSYQMVINELHVYANNEWLGVFVLYPDGRAIEYVEEDNGVLDEETDTETDNGAILDEIKDYLDSRKDENGKASLKAVLADAKTWIVTALSFLGSTGLGAIILGVINRINKRKEILTDAQIEKVANAAAKASTEKLIGKSIDVDISAEVSKAVKQELSALNNSVNSLVDGVKNAEMLSAEVAMAQSRSRLLTDEERHALRDAAAKVQEHAGKKVISAPKVKIKTKTEKVESAPVTEDVAQKNMYFINFDGVEKK